MLKKFRAERPLIKVTELDQSRNMGDSRSRLFGVNSSIRNQEPV